MVYQGLIANVAINSLDNVTTVQAGLGAQPGIVTVPILNPTRPLNFGSFHIGQFDTGEDVPMQTIDSLGLNRCHLIKVDVEGMECELLQGASETIRRHRPLQYVENDRSENSQRLIGLIQSFDYKL